MFAALQRVWNWADDHLTKILATIGGTLEITDVTGYAEPIKVLAGDLGYKVAIGCAFVCLFWRGLVTGRRGAAMAAQLNTPPDIP